MAAQSLRQAVGPTHDITLMAPSDRFDFRAAFPSVTLGQVQPEAIRLSLAALCQNAGIRFGEARLERIDPERRMIHSAETSWSYDYLGGAQL